MKSKILPTMLATLVFVVMMSVTALAVTAPTVRLVATAYGEDFVDVAVYVDLPADATAATGISALVVDLNYSAQLERQVSTRVFTAAGETTAREITGGITPGPLFTLPADQFTQPPATGSLLLFFEMVPAAGETGVLTTGGLAATIRFGVAEDPTGTATITPEVRHAYRWTDNADEDFSIRIPEANINVEPASHIFTGAPDPVFLVGDVNMDTFVNMADLIVLTQYVFNHPDIDICQEGGADINFDDVVNMADLILLTQFVFNHPGACLCVHWPEGTPGGFCS